MTSWIRRLTSNWRGTPDFIVVGAQKSGTTTLFHYLLQHPQLISAFKKEVHYFDGGLNPVIDNYEKGMSWYRSNFPLRINSNFIFFEVTPLYLFNPLVPKRIKKDLPNVKVIFLLRNPVDRAISHYFHSKKKGTEKLCLMDGLIEEELRLEEVIKCKDYKNKAYIHHSYKSRGLYKLQIARYLNYFHRDQCLFIKSEDFFANPKPVLRRIFEFVGADSSIDVNDVEAKNVTLGANWVDSNVYHYLIKFFERHNHELSSILGKDFHWH